MLNLSNIATEPNHDIPIIGYGIILDDLQSYLTKIRSHNPTLPIHIDDEQYEQNVDTMLKNGPKPADSNKSHSSVDLNLPCNRDNTYLIYYYQPLIYQKNPNELLEKSISVNTLKLDLVAASMQLLADTTASETSINTLLNIVDNWIEKNAGTITDTDFS